MFKRKSGEDFTYKVEDNCDHVFDERNNSFLSLRKVSWNGAEPKLELRKWFSTDQGEVANKGFSFLTEDGPHNLANVLLKNGFGKTTEVLKAIKDREDFIPSLNKVLGGNYENKIVPVTEHDNEDIEPEEEYYDPKEFLLS